MAVIDITPVVDIVPPSYEWVQAGVQQQFGDAPIAVTVDEPIVQRDGGYLLNVTLGGAGLADGNYNIYLGPLATTSDPLCYSGVSGQNGIIAIANNQFSCVSPILPIGGPYQFTFVEALTKAQEISEPAVTVVAHSIRSGTLAYRGLLPRLWLVGYRQSKDLEFPQT